MAVYFPMFFNIGQKHFYVFGAGRIAARRIHALVRYGAKVTVVAPQTAKEVSALFADYPGQMIYEQRAYRPGELAFAQADYVLAATDNEKINAAVVRECRHREIPVNNASDRAQCDFYFPALVEKGGLVIGITSTDGNHKKVADVSARLRKMLHEEEVIWHAEED